MKPISYAHHRFPPDVIRHAVWLYLRFTLSYRDVEDLLAERGLTVSNGIDTLSSRRQKTLLLRHQFMRPQLSHRSKNYALRSEIVSGSAG